MSRLGLLVVVLGCGLLGGCSIVGSSWDVRMEVQGDGVADVTAEFAGEDKGAQGVSLPFEASQNVGFGFNTLFVDKAGVGTVCRIYVNNVLRQEKVVDGEGKATCTANNQE